MAIKTQDILESLDSLVESHFRENLVSSIVQTNNNLFISIWKPPQAEASCGDREMNMKYLPLFYVIGNVEDSKICLKLITYHGKVIDEVNGKDFPLDDGNKISFIGKLNDIRLCRGICFDNQNVSWSIQSNVLLECLEDNLVLRSRQCRFGIFEEEALVCDSCDGLNIEDLKENIFQEETLEENIISNIGSVDDVDEALDNEYLPTNSVIRKKKKVVKRKGVKRKAKAIVENEDDVKQQLISNDGTDEKLNCDECPFTTKKRKKGVVKLAEHQEKVHQKVLPFQCEQCEYKFAYKRELEKHVSAVHMKIKPFLCNFCSYETAYKSQLSWHINIVHNKVKPFLCEYCPYKTSQKRNLTLHNRCKHEMVKPIKCTYEDCNYETISTSRLTTHIKFVHQKIKPFVCQLCPFATDTNYHLQNHINVSILKVILIYSLTLICTSYYDDYLSLVILYSRFFIQYIATTITVICFYR